MTNKFILLFKEEKFEVEIVVKVIIAIIIIYWGPLGKRYQ